MASTCSTLYLDDNCLLSAQGCFCRPGYVRKVSKGICVPVLLKTMKFSCETIFYKNVYKNLKCHCKPGYIRRVPGGICIPWSTCPKQ
uniref:TIL domain-containing protein n=1 Tax=Anopheles minimus TaxID=112268 RepID=A0A182VXB9_9DIPT